MNVAFSRRFVAASLAIVSLVALAAIWRRAGAPPAPIADAQASAPAPASATAPPSRVSAFARLRPQDGVLVLAGPATDFAFRVAHLDVSEGETVAAGRPLAELDVKSERAANLAVAEAQVREAEIAASFAGRELARKQKLYADNPRVISLEEFDQACNADEGARAKLETAKRQRDSAQIMLDEATIRAPVAGIVLHILRHEGEGVSADKGLIEFGAIAQMEAVAEVFETDARFVKPGQRAAFDSPALSKPARGTVARVLARVYNASLYSTNAAENTEARVVQVVIALDDDPEARMLSGLQGTAIIDTAGGS